VIVDSVFAEAGERQAIEAVAAGLALPFRGLWLEAPRDALVGRVSARRGDASDATAAVVAQQLARPIGALAWSTIDAAGSAADTEASARQMLGLVKS
jgi:predicted kinase